MSSNPAKILLQLDTDPQPSVFDAIVAIDAGVDHLLRHGNVTPDNVRGLVHGAMFTRGGSQLSSTAIFVGGTNVALADEVLAAIGATFFGPLRVSALLDAGGSNTTAAAAVLSAGRHLKLGDSTALVLGATGPVGGRVAQLLARTGAKVRLASRDVHRAEELRLRLQQRVPGASLLAVSTASADRISAALAGCQLVISAGALGVTLLPAEIRRQCESLRVGIDLNAVPPLGIEGIEPSDKGQPRDSQISYGAIGVGGLKMKIHRLAIQRLFQAGDQILDAQQVYELGQSLVVADNR